MAADGAAVLDAAGVARAHVFGVSMGGIIAQEFVLQYPERVDSLVLGCTAVRRPARHSRRCRGHQAAMTDRHKMTMDEALEASAPILYDSGTPRALIDEDFVMRRRTYPTAEAYMAQLMAIYTWQSYDRLPRIAAPTLVIHGESDRLVPPANGKVIAGRIPGAKLVMLPKAGHLFTTDQPGGGARGGDVVPREWFFCNRATTVLYRAATVREWKTASVRSPEDAIQAFDSITRRPPRLFHLWWPAAGHGALPHGRGPGNVAGFERTETHSTVLQLHPLQLAVQRLPLDPQDLRRAAFVPARRRQHPADLLALGVGQRLDRVDSRDSIAASASLTAS